MPSKPSKLLLPRLRFALPESAGKPDRQLYRRLIRHLQHLARSTGTRSDAFQARVHDLQTRLHQRRRLDQVVRTPQDIRALVFLWYEHDELIEQRPIDRATLDHLASVRPRQSLLVLFEMIQLFFHRFDEAGDVEALAAFLRDQFRRHRGRKLSRMYTRLAQHAELLLTAQGPENVARLALRNGISLQQAAAYLGLPVERQGRFFARCRHLYYLGVLQTLEVGQDHDVLRQLESPAVYESAYEGGWRLGHKVVQLMVDKGGQHDVMPDNWLRVILTIAGDPRVAAQTPQYERWWAVLGTAYDRRVRQWLARLDLDLFLEVLEDYVSQSGDEEMQRAFPERMHFLRGVLDKKLVRDTRLFLGEQARAYAEGYHRKRAMLSYAWLHDASRAVIYLNIGGLHVVEGTHNFYCWLYRALPAGNPIEDYTRQEFGLHELGQGLCEQYQAEFGNDGVTHISHLLGWQSRAISVFKEMGITIDPAEVLSPEDYRLYYGTQPSPSG